MKKQTAPNMAQAPWKAVYRFLTKLSSNTLAKWCKELTRRKGPWCWQRLRAGGEGDDRGWDGWMASPTRWTWVWVNSGSWWWTGRPGVLRFMGLQRVRHDWVTELNWTQIWSWNITKKTLIRYRSRRKRFECARKELNPQCWWQGEWL